MCPLTGEELSEDFFEVLIDLFASSVSEHGEVSSVSEHFEDTSVPDYCGDSSVSDHCGDSRVSEAHVYTQDRDRARPLKRSVTAISDP